MTTFQLIAVVVALTAGLAFVNARFLRLPASVGLMATALLGSIAILALESAGAIHVTGEVRALVERLDFGNTLLHGMLGLLLFAGALHIDVGDLGAERGAVALLAIGSTLASVAIVGLASYVVLGLLGHPLALVDALLFGALVAPTDPIAVLGMLKTARAPRRLEARIAGESLFNDGVGVVVFTVLLAVRGGGGDGHVDVGGAVVLFVREGFGGAAFGFASGWVVKQLVRSIDDYSVELLLTLALVMGGYAAAEAIDVSAPIGAVVAGLVIGNRAVAADRTREHVDRFWKLLDEVLNAVLFLMMGLVILLVPISLGVIGAGACAIAISLVGRWISVAAALAIVPSIRRAIPHSIAVLTWGGLRGGLSIAMALALPAGGARDLTLVMTYAIVAFSILVQGLTFPRLLVALGVGEPAVEADPHSS